MIGAARYFARRYVAARYWTKVGAAPPVFQAMWARGSTVLVGRDGGSS